jgi:hypothetical protein
MADHSNLPAPYESPWRQLGRAARAVVASLGLDLRSLWRRNRSGELPRVPWWPRDLAPLFWPLVLAAALGLVLSAAGWLAGLQPQPQQAAAPLTTAAETSKAAAATNAPDPEDNRPETVEEPVEDPVKEPVEEPTEEPNNDPLKPDPGLATSASLAAEPATPPSETLRDRISADDREHWIMAAEARPEQQLVVLQLGDGFNRQDPLARRRQAERWLERIRELGFEQLELRSPDGELLGYRARVGSGMILLEPAASA